MNANDGVGYIPAPVPAKSSLTRRRKIILALLVLVVGLAIISFFAVLVTSFRFRVEGESMSPTLKSDNAVLVNKAIYALRSPQRGDLIVFEPPTDPDTDFIKRVIAVEGETIEIKPDPNPESPPNHDCGGCGVFVNGVKLDEPYTRENPDYVLPPTEVSPGQVFVLGDNRNNSSDSHIWGPLDKERIVGKAIFSMQPFGFLPGASYPNLSK